MAELTSQERLQPALLDRLADDDPARKQEPREARLINTARLRQAVLRDLAWLFNSVQLADTTWAAFPYARHSVINFGLPALSGETASTLDVIQLENSIRQSILDFEPRLVASTVRIEAVVSDLQLDHHNVITVQIQGDLWGQPLPLEMLLRTDVDLETGEVRIHDLSPVAGMDPRLLRYYNQELQHLREMGGEFALQFPKIAGRLGMAGIEVADPYVERLMEGFAFLAARVQLKIDAEFPRFTQRLLEIVHPNYLAPIPAMLMAQFHPDLADGNLARGLRIPRGSNLRSQLGKGDAEACLFRTAHDVTLLPLELVSAAYFSVAPDLPLATIAIPGGQKVKGGIRLRLRLTAGLSLSQVALGRLRFHLTGSEEVAFRLYERLLGACIRVLVRAPSKPATWMESLPGSSVKAAGFQDDEALLPPNLRSFQGYRLLREYFSFPQRFLFFDVDGLSDAVRGHGGNELELVFLFDKADAMLEKVVDRGNVALNCTPAVNLLERRCDRVHLSDGTYSYHVVPDRTKPMDFEVFEVTGVTGYGAGADSERRFLPFYAAYHSEDLGHNAYYTVDREPRLLSAGQKQNGPRSSYVGSEVFISLVDRDEAPFAADLRQLGVTALCTNRDLPLHMPLGTGKTDFTLDVAAPVESIRAVAGPSKPSPAVREGNVAWTMIDQLSLNYLSLFDTDAGEAVTVLREMLQLHVGSGGDTARKQIDGLRSVAVRPIVRRFPLPGPVTFGRGLRIELEVDELAFAGGSAFLFGSVLERFFARYVSINSFTETVLRSTSRGEIMHWVPRCGERLIA